MECVQLWQKFPIVGSRIVDKPELESWAWSLTVEAFLLCFCSTDVSNFATFCPCFEEKVARSTDISVCRYPLRTVCDVSQITKEKMYEWQNAEILKTMKTQLNWRIFNDFKILFSMFVKTKEKKSIKQKCLKINCKKYIIFETFANFSPPPILHLPLLSRCYPLPPLDLWMTTAPAKYLSLLGPNLFIFLFCFQNSQR